VKDVTLLTIISFVLFMSVGITSPVSSLYAESLGASYVVIGLLSAATSLTTIFFSYVWGRASDQLGQRKTFLTAGLATLAVGRGLMAVVPSYEYLFILNVLSSTAQAAYGTSSLALMGDLLERRSGERGRRIGTFRGLGSLGFGLTAFLSGSLADRFSIRAPFLLSGLALVVAFLLTLKVEEPSSDPAARMTLQGRRGFGRLLVASTRDAARSMIAQFAVLAGRRFESGQPAETGTASVAQDAEVGGSGRLPLAPLLLSAFLWSLAFGAVYSVWANYMVSELGYAQADVGRLWSLAALTEFPMMILSGWLSDRVGRLPMLSVGFLTWSLIFAGYVFVPVMPWIIVIQLTRGFAYSAFTATAMTYAAEARPRSQRGWVSGLYGSSSGIGTILGSLVGGSLAQFFGFRAMILTNGVLFLGGAAYLAVVAIRQAARVRRILTC
jgi:MFS family permease